MGCNKKFRQRAIPYIKENYKNLKEEHIKGNVFEDHTDIRIEYTIQLLSLSEDNFQSVIMSHEGKKCFCSKKLRDSQIYFIPSCFFRAYHVDCYMKYFWLELKKKKNEEVIALTAEIKTASYLEFSMQKYCI